MFDLQIPFFRPLWRRILLVALCLGWGVVELSFAAYFWATIFIGVGLYASYEFFLNFNPDQDDTDAD
jgi:hypothetical protein